MNSATAERSICTYAGIVALKFCATALPCALVAACASPPPLHAPAPTASVMTRAALVGATLQVLGFEQLADGYHLTLPAPLIFSFDSDVVASSARDTLTRVGRELRELGIDRALVRGHTDNVGTHEYNFALSKRRADAVAKVLVEGGYPAENIDTKGLGASLPEAENTTPEGRAKNRRVVIIVQLI